MPDDKITKYLLYCKRHLNTPDLHSFMVAVRDGVAFVELKGRDLVRIDVRDSGEVWSGTIEDAADKLTELGADPETVEM